MYYATKCVLIRTHTVFNFMHFRIQFQFFSITTKGYSLHRYVYAHVCLNFDLFATTSRNMMYGNVHILIFFYLHSCYKA